MIYGDFFTRSLEALGFFRDSIAQCFECMRVCPVGREAPEAPVMSELPPGAAAKLKSVALKSGATVCGHRRRGGVRRPRS